MFDSVTVLAPAKINLGLQVFSKREDGYHNLKSIFVTVGLFDELTVSPIVDRNTCIVECDKMRLPEQNTITLAYKAFCVLTGIDCGVKVSIKKRIPAGGGLGGGSSDASSFIQSVNNLFNTKLSIDSLSAIASKVGSDVFFFTYALSSNNGKRFDCFEPFAALVEGRGEKVHQINCRNDYSVLLVFPQVGVSTKIAYDLVDKRGLCESEQFSFEDMYKKPIGTWKFKNDFTVPVCEKFEEVSIALRKVKETGAAFADMSGSGSTVFGIYENRKLAENAKKQLEKKFKVAVC